MRFVVNLFVMLIVLEVDRDLLVVRFFIILFKVVCFWVMLVDL